ncbi:structural maintenance of chromosomes protein 6A-like [Lotus japonicus]|uniref:structural maintenance of chromosomes protein 6A-like n=1 Tax=Lotus japonicus TaxID=34305 RepID=UPI0025866559|nr:structural maintenance of chromosomes protein 6A-like [Lotus japonicus]
MKRRRTVEDDDPPSSSRVSSPTAGIIKRLRLENFMCHSNHETEFGKHVNFITGQNGSGKSAILTALCVAFGCRAKGTQRAATLKDFIKTGASNAVIHVEIQNEGEDAFKPEVYGDVIIVERRISESTSSTTLKDCQGKKVCSRKTDLQEIVEHFNIDVENPCVIMSQDKSREFLHSGNEKDKFKFFYKATLLQQVNDLLEGISREITTAHAIVQDLETAIRPIEKELNELQVKIKAMEQVEKISLRAQQLKKKLAWSWVYDVDKQLEQQNVKIEKLKNRIPTCQAKIDQQLHRIEELKERCSMKKAEIASMLDTTSQVKQMKESLRQSMSLARKEKLECERDYNSKRSSIQKLEDQLKKFEGQMHGIQEQHVKNTQAEVSNMEEKMNKLRDEFHVADSNLRRLKEEEALLMNEIQMQNEEIKKIVSKIQDHGKKERAKLDNIGVLQRQQSNTITVFGGDRVMHLLHIIEDNHRKFKMPPIGPIGAHLKLLHGKQWAVAIEYAIGRLFNSFIVTDYDDFRLLKKYAMQARYGDLRIIIYDFSTPRLTIPQHMLPNTKYPTALSVLQCENHTVNNVLVDLGSVERQVLVNDYETGKEVAFEQRIQNLKEVYTASGSRMFSRGPVQTVLPGGRKRGRLSISFEDEIAKLRNEAADEEKEANDCRRNKRVAEEKLEELHSRMNSIKKRCAHAGHDFTSKKLALEMAEHEHAAERGLTSSSSVDEIGEAISEIQKKKDEEQVLLKNLQQKKHEAAGKADDLKTQFDKLCESTNGEIAALEKAETELVEIERDMDAAQEEKHHYDGVMKNKVLRDIQEAEEHNLVLTKRREEFVEKASIICCVNELNSLGGCDGDTPEKISAQLEEVKQTLRRESPRYSESIDDLRMLYAKKERKITKRQQVYKALRQKLDACERALKVRRNKFQTNASCVKRQLSWKFNTHLRRKGISGLIRVNYEKETLSIEVQMPQDASNKAVQDTRGLSGGERSFSTLCFALALHEMTESPFRAMDEFDVFMDAVSRKISLDTLVDFAVEQGSQWICITPHDTSSVKAGDRVKKMQMAAPRS